MPHERAACDNGLSMGGEGVKGARRRLAAGIFLFFLACLPPTNFSRDGNSMLAVAESLASQGTFAVSPANGERGADGRYYSVWYPLLSVLERKR